MMICSKSSLKGGAKRRGAKSFKKIGGAKLHNWQKDRGQKFS